MSDESTRLALTIEGVDKTADVIGRVANRLDSLSKQAASANKAITGRLDLMQVRQAFTALNRGLSIVRRVGSAINEGLNKPLEEAAKNLSRMAAGLADSFGRIRKEIARNNVRGFGVEGQLNEMSGAAEEASLQRWYRRREAEISGQFGDSPTQQAQRELALVKMRAEEEDNIVRSRMNWEEQNQRLIRSESDARRKTIREEQDQALKNRIRMEQVGIDRQRLAGVTGGIPQVLMPFFSDLLGGDPKKATVDALDDIIDAKEKELRASEDIIKAEQEAIRDNDDKLRVARARVEALKQELTELEKIHELERANADANAIEAKRAYWRKQGEAMIDAFGRAKSLAGMVLGGSYEAMKVSQQKNQDTATLRSMLEELKRFNENIEKLEAV